MNQNEEHVNKLPFTKAYRTIYKSVQNWLHEIYYESSYQPNNITEVHPRVVRINKRIERFTQMRANKQLSSISTQVTNYGIGRQLSSQLLFLYISSSGGLCEAHTDPGGDPTDPRVRVTGDTLATVMGWLSEELVGGATTFYIGPDLVRMWPTR